MDSLRVDTIRRWIKESIDYDHYDRMYAQQLFMSGDSTTILNAMKGEWLRTSTALAQGGELPSYPELVPTFGDIGAQNHAIVNSRIIVQGLSMKPDLNFQHSEPVFREFNQAYFRDLWLESRMDVPFYMGGMELEANGYCCFEIGEDDGVPGIEHSPNLDTIFDMSDKTPSKKEWFCRRKRRSPEWIQEKYPCLSKDDIDRLKTKGNEGYGAQVQDVRTNRVPRSEIVEWRFWHRQFHIVFLRSIHGTDAVGMILDKNLEYKKVDLTKNPELGPNPYGMVNFTMWADSWSPSVAYPVSKMDNTIRQAALLNEVEECMVQIMRNTVPVTAIDVTRVYDKEILMDLKKARSWKDLSKILLLEGNINELMHRTPPGEIPSVLLQLRSILKDELNGSTGVQDMQRGAALGGERRTRFEVNQLVEGAGVQARHVHRQFAYTVEDVISKLRVIGALYDTRERVYILETYGSVDTKYFPVSSFLSPRMPLEVSEESLSYKTEEERKQEAIAELQAFHLPYIQLGAIDVTKSLNAIGRRYGYKDPATELGVGPMLPAGMTGQPPMAGQPPMGAPAPAQNSGNSAPQG